MFIFTMGANSSSRATRDLDIRNFLAEPVQGRQILQPPISPSEHIRLLHSPESKEQKIDAPHVSSRRINSSSGVPEKPDRIQIEFP